MIVLRLDSALANSGLLTARPALASPPTGVTGVTAEANSAGIGGIGGITSMGRGVCRTRTLLTRIDAVGEGGNQGCGSE